MVITVPFLLQRDSYEWGYATAMYLFTLMWSKAMIWPAVKKAFINPVSLHIAEGKTHSCVTANVITNGTIVTVIDRSTMAKFTTRMAAVVRRLLVRRTAIMTKMFPKMANTIVQPMATTETRDAVDSLSTVLLEWDWLAKRGIDPFSIVTKNCLLSKPTVWWHRPAKAAKAARFCTVCLGWEINRSWG